MNSLQADTDTIEIDDLDTVIGPSGATDAVSGGPCLVIAAVAIYIVMH